MSNILQGFQRLDSSERHPSPSTKALGAADPNETFTVTIVLRRRLDGAPLPDHDFFLNTPPSQRRRMPSSDFAALYGASDEDIDKVTSFVTVHHLTVVETNAARRTVVVSGTVKQMEVSFAIKLGRFEHQIVRGAADEPETETYRGLDGFIHIPGDLAGIIVGVFGLDNRTVTLRNNSDSDDPSNTVPLTVAKITSLYHFPDQSAAGQTIAIFSEGGYKLDDIKKYFSDLGLDVPKIQDVYIDGAKKKLKLKKRRETTMDICISASAAPGASVTVYFTPGTENGWVDLFNKVAHPGSDDPVCSVLSSSYYRYDGDDGDDDGKQNFMDAVSMAFQDAALQGVTVCVASGDRGSYSKIEDSKAHVQYPASDPWVLSVGGTTVGNVDGSSYTEYVWNHGKGATGGGVSAYFDLPSYQKSASVPVSANDSKSKGRGVPDVAANSSPDSGYSIPLDGDYHVMGGTSAAAPLWAGLIARINAAIGENVGFINPVVYALGSSVCNDIDGSEGPSDNKVKDTEAPGYPATPGWDACTGWGSINGSALLNGLARIFTKRCTIIPFFQTFRLVETNSRFIQATFTVRVDGFRPADFGIQIGPPITSNVNPVINITSLPTRTTSGDPISCTLTAFHVQDDTLPPTPQRFRWVYSLTSTSNAVYSLSGQTIILVRATVTSLEGDSVTSQAVIRLVRSARSPI